MSRPLPTSRDAGFALILVLWLCLALASAALCFGHVALLGHRTTDGGRAELQCRQTVRSAVPYVEALLGTASEGELPELEEEDMEQVLVGDSALWLVAPIWSESPETSYGLVSEAGKLNLNTATKDMIMVLPGMTEAVAAAIVDWRDADSEPESYGAEDETYSRKDPPYRAKNGDFDSVEELLMVDGVDEDLLYGKDRNQNGVIDPWEGDSNSTNLADYGIYHLVTVYSSESNESSSSSGSGSESGGQSGDQSSSGKTNVTSSSALRSYLAQKFSAQVASQAANAGPYTSVLQFAAKSGLTRDQFSQVADDLTASDDDTVTGLVNVNVAPLAVLQCLPGVGEDGAKKLISYRTENSDSLTNITWVLDALGDECASELGPYVTTKTYQVSADVVVVADLRRAVRRVRLVFDLSSGSAKLVARRDLSDMPWPLGEELWNELKANSLASLTE